MLLWFAAEVVLDQDQLRGFSLTRIAVVVAAVNALLTPIALKVTIWMFKTLASERSVALRT